MRRIKNILMWALILLGIFVGIWIALDNSQVVEVQLLGFSLPSMSLGLWLVIVFVAGVLLGLLASLPMIATSRSESRRLKRNQNL